MSWRSVTLALTLLLTSSSVALAKGRLAGRVLAESGGGVGGIRVALGATDGVRITDREGSYFFERVPEGSYSITLSLGGDTLSIVEIEVVSGQTTTIETTVDWQASFAEEITVAASRRVERVVDAPAAVISLSEQVIARESGFGEIPRLLESAPGVDVVNASGFFYEVNARGFNGYNNRRVQVFYDGVDQAVPFAGFQEYFPRNVMDLASMELVKGPSSSLYGANAFNGVLNLTTKRPDDSRGGSLRLTGGDPTLLRADLRWTGPLGAGWFFKLVGNYQEGESFTKSRNETTEYPGLPMELLPLPVGKVGSGSTSLRFDRRVDAGSRLSLEAGFKELDPGRLTALAFPGRFTLVEPIEETWLRLGFTSRYLDARGYYKDRQAPDFVDLSTGGHFFDDSQVRHIEILAHHELRRLRVVGGASYQEDDIGHSVIGEPITSEAEAAFGQVDFEPTDRVRLVIAARWDEGTLYDGRLSPKAGVVWGITPRHTLRLTYNDAFQAPTYGDFFLDLPFFLPTSGGPVPAVDLSDVEASECTPFGVSCGFQTPTPARLVGNEDLKVEEIKAIEAGYSGILGDGAFLTVDYYRNELENFLTQPLPNPFGTFNSRFTPYRPPSGLPVPGLLESALREELGMSYPFLLTDRDGSPIFVPFGFTNAGQVETQGVDVALSYAVESEWQFELSYSWFDFEVKDQGVGGALSPNTPENKLALGLTYLQTKFDASVRYRWVEGFGWSSGVFMGRVPAYNVLSVSGNYVINDRYAVGLNVVNLLDDEHYEAFGGDLLGRRALLSATVNW